MAEGAVEVVAVLALIVAAELRLGDPAEVADRGEGDVGERQPDQLAVAAALAVALGGEQAEGGQRPHRDVPGGQHAVQRLGHVARPGRPGEPGRRVDRVVDLAGAVRVAGQGDHDQVLAALAQRVELEPAAGREVGQEAARPGDELTGQLAPALAAQVDLDRALALVEARPEEALAIVGERPAAVVETAADLVEADHVRPVLSQRHAAERRGDERRPLDHRHTREDLAGHRPAPAQETADDSGIGRQMSRKVSVSRRRGNTCST